MKKLQEKFTSIIPVLSGKKPKVIIVSLIIIGLCLLGVKYGYISEEMLDFNVIVNNVESIVDSPVDTATMVTDSAKIVVDSLSH